MKEHSAEGARIVGKLSRLSSIVPIVRHHHQRWDGRGYPDGLTGEDIPLVARVFAVADTLDALTTDRPYRPASELRRAREVIDSLAGTQFDPSVVAAFDDVPDAELEAIRTGVQ
jgi:response regulator RpfG family c-di-GMP phosphodiesterase